MKHLLCIVAILLAGCDGLRTPTYEELKKYPKSCAKEAQQLAELRGIKNVRNFSDDPDQLNDEDRAYNSLLKLTIWWYATECHRETNTATANADQ